jgi:hypothetical protein
VFRGTSNQTANLFSDLLLHDMGTNLADGISQGAAGPDQFRTARLWGVGQRILFLHDGTTTDLLDAINEHSSTGSEAVGGAVHGAAGSRIVGNKEVGAAPRTNGRLVPSSVTRRLGICGVVRARDNVTTIAPPPGARLCRQTEEDRYIRRPNFDLLTIARMTSPCREKPGQVRSRLKVSCTRP